MNQLTPLTSYVPEDPSSENLLDNFLRYTTDQGLELYAAQEEAIEFFKAPAPPLSQLSTLNCTSIAFFGHVMSWP